MADVMRLRIDDPRMGLREGDLLLTVPYRLDLGKVTVICRLSDGFQPECNQYRSSVEPVSDDHLTRFLLALLDRLAAVEALADRWERENRRPSGPGDHVGAGVWSATRSDIAEVRAVLREPVIRPAPTTGREVDDA